HLKKPRTLSNTYTVLERLLVCLSFVEIIGSEDRGLSIVITRVDDMRHRVFYPIRRLRSSALVENQNIDGENRRSTTQLRSVREGVLRILNSFQHAAEFMKQTGKSASLGK